MEKKNKDLEKKIQKMILRDEYRKGAYDGSREAYVEVYKQLQEIEHRVINHTLFLEFKQWVSDQIEE